jgi:ATP-binding cassette, subfamily B, bacterial PglK
VLGRIWRLLDGRERRRVVWIAPLLIVSAGLEIVGVAAVIPFLSLLTDPQAAETLPIVGDLVRSSGVDDGAVLIRYAGIALALVVLMANTLVLLTYYWLFRFSWSLNHSISTRLLGHFLRQPYAFTLTRNTASLANKVVAEVRQLVQNGVQAGLEIMTKGVMIVALVGFLVVLDPMLAATAFGVLGLTYGSIFAASRRFLRSAGREAIKAGAARLKAVNQALGAFKDLKVATREGSALRQYAVPSRQFAAVQAGIQSVSVLPRYALEAVAVGGIVAIASIVSGREGAIVTTLPVLGAYAFAGLRLMPAMQHLFNAAARLRSVTGALESVEAELRITPEDDGALRVVPEPMAFSKVITFSEVSYSYPGGEGRAIHCVSLDVRRGRNLAIIGRTGSGKTTLVDLLLGLLEPESGSIMVDDIHIDRTNRRAYRRLFGYVPQEIYLLDDTIRRNVALGLAEDEIDDEAVRRACEQAQAVDFIEQELLDRFDTVVGERGVRLSGGQRQRIGIARALYHRPPVLVFDEATSALDVHTERQLYQALELIARDHTVVTVAHRLDTVSKADDVIVLERGRIVDAGPPSEVLARYRRTAGASS